MNNTGKNTRAQIVVTLGPASSSRDLIEKMISAGMGAARLNLSWPTMEEHDNDIKLVHEISKKLGEHVPIILDLPGPRVQEEHGHTYEKGAHDVMTEHDKKLAAWGIERDVDYVALSFVSGVKEIETCRKLISEKGGNQRVIAKIERKIALERLDLIVKAADAIMVARGDLGQDIPLEEVPFAQDRIIKKCKAAGKPVITATEMMLSMTENPRPERAEVTDVATAILEGSDAVMLSEETARGRYPVEVVAMMERIIVAAERHMEGKIELNHL